MQSAYLAIWVLGCRLKLCKLRLLQDAGLQGCQLLGDNPLRKLVQILRCLCLSQRKFPEDKHSVSINGLDTS